MRESFNKMFKSESMIVEQGDFSDPSPFSFIGTRTDEETSHLAGGSILKPGVVQSSTRRSVADTTGNPSSVADITKESSSFPLNK